jgi:hypothetical protein
MDDVAIASLRKNGRETLRIQIREFKKRRFVDVRLFASNGVEEVSTSKGVTIKPDLLRATIEALQEAERVAAERGLFR